MIFGTPEADNAPVQEDLIIMGVALVPGENNGTDLNPVFPRQSQGTVQICREGIPVLSFFQAVVMRESMSGDFLPPGQLNLPNQAVTKMEGIILFTLPYTLPVGIQPVVLYGGLREGEISPCGPGKHYPHHSPGCPDMIFSKAPGFGNHPSFV